ncbi:MAG: DUF3006 domain-containing protein [Ruminococcus sp.]|nr:DUF3006 domain-containing protein [Ruminococcus sp.]
MIILDRFECETAVIETENGMINVPKSCIADNTEEGDVLLLKDGKYIPDKKATKERRNAVSEKLLKLWQM